MLAYMNIFLLLQFANPTIGLGVLSVWFLLRCFCLFVELLESQAIANLSEVRIWTECRRCRMSGLRAQVKKEVVMCSAMLRDNTLILKIWVG